MAQVSTTVHSLNPKMTCVLPCSYRPLRMCIWFCRPENILATLKERQQRRLSVTFVTKASTAAKNAGFLGVSDLNICLQARSGTFTCPALGDATLQCLHRRLWELSDIPARKERHRLEELWVFRVCPSTHGLHRLGIINGNLVVSFQGSGTLPRRISCRV